MDTLTKSGRSALMSRITGNKLGPETRVAKAMRDVGLKFRRNVRSLPGSPDFVLKRTAVFVHGCFWHGRPHHYRKPKSNSRFWSEKLAGNRRRDQRACRALRGLKWRVLTVWECQTRGDSLRRAVARIWRAANIP